MLKIKRGYNKWNIAITLLMQISMQNEKVFMNKYFRNESTTNKCKNIKINANTFESTF